MHFSIILLGKQYDQAIFCFIVGLSSIWSHLRINTELDISKATRSNAEPFSGYQSANA